MTSTIECDQLFKIPANLQHLSIINIAVSYWNYTDVRIQIGNYVLGLNGPVIVKKEDEGWNNVLGYVMKFVEEIKLPANIKSRIKAMMIIIGEKILYWYQHIFFHLSFEIEYAKDICWTPYGQIDELEILRKHWSKDVNFPSSKCNCFLRNPLFCMACMYADENFVCKNSESMKKVIFPFLSYPQRKDIRTDYGLIATWLCFCIGNAEQKGLEILRSFRKCGDNIPAGKLLIMCASRGFTLISKYLWNRLPGDEKQKYVIEAATACVKGLTKNRYDDVYKQENYIDILLLFINEMSPIQKSEFITVNFSLLFEIMLENWPYQESSIQFINKTWDFFLDHHEQSILIVLGYLSQQSKINIYKNESAYYDVLEEIIQKASEELKMKFFSANSPALCEMYKSFKLTGICLIINSLPEQKTELLEVAEDFFRNDVRKGEYEKLDTFIDKVFGSSVDKKRFKQRLNVLFDFLTSGEFELADEHINWLSDSESERIEMKKQVNSLKICSVLIEINRLDLADEFLSWRFGEDGEQIIIIKELLILNEFLSNKIFKIWGGMKHDKFSVDEVERKCAELFNWFFGTEEDVLEFKKTKLVKNELFLKYFWDNLFYETSFKFLDDFLKFCKWSSEEIVQMKRKIAGNIIWWIDTFALENKYIRLVDALLDWVCEDKNHKKNIVKEYMESPQGVFLFLNMFKKGAHNSPKDIMLLFNSWIVPFIDGNLIKDKLKVLKKDWMVDPEACYAVDELMKRIEEDYWHHETISLDSLEEYVEFQRYGYEPDY